MRIHPRWLLLCACLACCGALRAQSLSHSIGQADVLLAQLYQQIHKQPESLQVKLPARNQRHSLKELGLYPLCRPPVLVRAAPPVRAMSQCMGMESSGGGLTQVQAAIFWDHSGNAWQSGRMLRLQLKDLTRYRTEPQNDAALENEQAMVQAMAQASPEELQALERVWQNLSAMPLEEWPGWQDGAPEAWPEDLLAMHRDGRLRLSGSRLGGLHAWQAWWAALAKPATVEALVGVKSRLDGVVPALQLAELQLAERPFAVVLLPASRQPTQARALWSDRQWQLLMVRLDERS
ncbi:conserved exported hypothetical protein [Pseudomonas sp. 8AS]|uniref:hypothetical protein n=1 Tax=Pseudomonas sp. 8AS TaxID=2653163 RepID=UPI0012EFE9F8|nr:hypothetical protein [Pseudomonas sp. 8AS]VXC18346.1 conserved exported hypothetical protein [Pseudomonas sp. 8AS]